MKLRSHLLVLSFATLLPLVLFAVYVSSLLVERERETFRQGVADRARAVLTAVDVQLMSVVTALEALAASQTLQRGDLQGFHAEAQRVLAMRPDWYTIHLAVPSGQQVMNATYPYGAPLPTLAGRESLERVIESRAPTVGNMTKGAMLDEYAMPIRVPVMRDGQVQYVLSGVVRPQSLNALLAAQRLPAELVAALVDGSGRIVARSRDPEKFTGSLATADLRAAMARGPEGSFEGTTLDGARVYGWQSRSAFSGWTIVIGVPLATVNAGATRTMWLMSFGVLGALGIALVLASILSREIARPLASLSAAAQAIGRGDRIKADDGSTIDELGALSTALDEAAEAVREREARQKRAEEALRSADRAKDEFLAMLGHELRNPLAAIANASHVLRRSADPRVAGTARGVIERQIEHVTRLLEDLLDVSRVTRGKVNLVCEPVSLDALVAGLVETWRRSGRLDDHRVSVALDPAWIDADAARIEQIVSNLLDNALKYTPPDGSIRIDVCTEGGFAVLRVADSGSGLSPELSRRMFDLFVQGERTLDRGLGGLGIGLTMVKQLAELHGGSVEGSSEGVGRGATFTVRLPAIEAPAVRPDPAAASAPLPPSRILVIEDNDDARQSLVQALQLEGHDVHAALDGPAGLALADAVRPDVVLLDIGLPGMDGYEVARRLRANFPERRPLLVAVTGYGQPEDQARARDAGFDAHLMKPVTMAQIAATLERLMAARGVAR